jgi:hypothetical protein
VYRPCIPQPGEYLSSLPRELRVPRQGGRHDPKNMTYINHDGHQMTSDLMKQWPEHSKSQRERSEQLFSLRKLFLQALAQK